MIGCRSPSSLGNLACRLRKEDCASPSLFWEESCTTNPPTAGPSAPRSLDPLAAGAPTTMATVLDVADALGKSQPSELPSFPRVLPRRRRTAWRGRQACGGAGLRLRDRVCLLGGGRGRSLLAAGLDALLVPDEDAVDAVALEILAGSLRLVLVKHGEAGAVVGRATFIHGFGKRIRTNQHFGRLALHG